MTEQTFSKYEQARILGARALQISMNAPLLIKISQEDLEKIKFDSLKIAETELNSGILPISINKPFPQKKEDGKLKRTSAKKLSDEETEKMEVKEEEEIAKEGEIMELANPDDEQDSGDSENSSDIE